SRAGQPEANFSTGSGKYQGLDQPTDVAVAPDGTVYAVDLRGRVARFSAAGQVDLEYPLPVGQQRGGSHIALWGDYIAVTNPDTGSISLVDLKTGDVRSVKITGDDPPTLRIPVGITAGSDGRLYVLDSGNDRVVILEKAP